jgi:tRNA pseudouridine38-40 synthase
VTEPAHPTGEGGLGPVMRVRIDLSYDGTDFAGWARQPGQRTVAGTLEEVLLRHPPGGGVAGSLVVAGRTDAGVHARGQVAHVDVRRVPVSSADGGPLGDLDRLRFRWNRMLPFDIRVHRVAAAATGFDARFSPLRRRYSYRVADPVALADPLRRRDTLWYPRALDLEAMNRAAAPLLGERDFASFCRRRVGATTVRSLLRLEWTRDADGVAVATVEADAFCHSMVRALVGALLSVGDESRDESWPTAVLADAVRQPDVHVVAARGLCLDEVTYPSDAQLAARAAQTRRVRTVTP